MKSKKITVSLLIIFIFLFGSIISINGISASNVNYTFNRNVLFENDDTIESFDQEFNMRDVSVFQGHYNGTYGFIGEGGKESTDISFVDTDSSENEASISITGLTNTINGHREVIQYSDGGNIGDFSQSENNIDSQTFGTIEFMILTENITTFQGVYILTDSTLVIAFAIWQGLFQHNDGSWKDTGTFPPINDIWYHIRIDFECSGGGYLSLPQYDWRLTVNGTLIDDFNFRSNQNSINVISPRTSTSIESVEFSFFLDGIGYSWENYILGGNLIPILETTTSLKQVDRAEFAISEPNVFYDGDDTNLDGFSIFELSDGLVVPAQDNSDINDRVLSMSVQDAGDVAQIFIDDIGKTGITFIHVSLEATIQEFDGQGGGIFDIGVRSSDNTKIGGFKFDVSTFPTFEIAVWKNGFFTIAKALDYRNNMRIEHYLDYEFEIQITDIYINSTFINRTIFDIAEPDKEGLKRVEIDLSASAVAGSVNVDSVGIYTNALPITEGLGWYIINIASDWNFKNYNLFSKRLNGFLHIATVEGYYQVDDFPDTFEVLQTFQEYSDTIDFRNFYQMFETVDNSSLVLTINGSLFSISEIAIEGVKLNEGSNEYILNLDYGNVNIDNSYFIVDDFNRLQFSLTVNENNTLEFIEATFTIDGFNTNDKAISFRSSIQNIANGLFFINDFDNFSLSVLGSTQRIALTEGNSVTQFIIIVSDLDNNDITDTITTGFVSNIIIIPTSEILDIVLIGDLLTMLIPIIIILIPTVALRELYGKVFVMPIFLLMSFILVLGGILPIWLMFIIMLSSSTFILKSSKLKRIME